MIAFVLLSGSFPFLKDEADLNDKVRCCTTSRSAALGDVFRSIQGPG